MENCLIKDEKNFAPLLSDPLWHTEVPEVKDLTQTDKRRLL